ncbi:uncharacterized protein LOC111031177 [Myzus persicae]|uniref:uncharacterized protein LOC111031177 n=1 Tax=Myzus persicae TaxID=13164 RepID=UPI000B9311B6|nr:uncharacterized protein LOC111031177 [Myzus persicae]
MGLLVDVVLQGKGNTNDGNTARRFFKNPEKSAEITGIDFTLLQRFGNILSVIASGRKINPITFDEYALATATLFVQLYPWYYMPASVHKILIHGADVIKFAILPIGQLSEEAQEARNKDYKRIRQNHTRKNSRLNTNKDLIHMLLVSSDPYISSIRELPNKCRFTFSDDLQNLFMFPEYSDKSTNALNSSFSEMEINENE